jgi:hypothetical protein
MKKINKKKSKDFKENMKNSTQSSKQLIQMTIVTWKNLS